MTAPHQLPKPPPFLTVRCHKTDVSPTLCGLCVGYENTAWRAQQLADHIVSWLPEFALSPAEWVKFNHANAIDFVRKAAKTVYQTDKFKKRGEFGELFLHAAIRQVHDSVPAISKIFYKSATNDTVKGFDAVHVVGPPDNMELWLGEAKFYNDLGAAIRDVTKELDAHLQTDYLRGEFLLIGNKLDENVPHTPILRRLLARETSLDEVFKVACVPVLLTYDSDCVTDHSECSDAYVAAFEEEIQSNFGRFGTALSKLTLPSQIRIHLFLLPLQSKRELVKILDQKLKLWQQI